LQIFFIPDKLEKIEVHKPFLRENKMEFNLTTLKKIQKQIDDACEYEQQHNMNSLLEMVQTFSENHQGELDPKQLEKVASFLELYIKHSPAIILSIFGKAEAAGVTEKILPVLNFAAKYYSSRADVILDGWSLKGLIDDAYVVHLLIQSFSDSYKEESNLSLIKVDTTSLNTFVRLLIGEPEATTLDNIVSEAISGSDIKSCLRSLSINNEGFGNVPDPTWKDKENIENLVNSHMTKIGIA
jgi:hypothetical protein